MIINANRRHLLAAAMATPLWASWAARAAAHERDADTILHNGRLITTDDTQLAASAMAIKDGRIMAVGGDAVKGLAGKSTRMIDLKGACVVPGFIDCHNHPIGDVLLYETLVGNPFEVEFVTIASIIDKLRAKAAVTPPGYWVDGYFHDDTKLKDGRQLTVDDLDRISTTHPVMVRHRGGHTVFVNSFALAMAGVTRDTQNPPGGTFDRLPDGRLSGRITDNAIDLVEEKGQRPVLDAAEKAKRARAGMAHISGEFSRYGLTTVHHQGGDLAAIQDVRAAGGLKHRVNYEAWGAMVDQMIAAGLKTGFGDDWIKLGATAEHTADGSFSERTMALSTPYAGRTPAYYGNVTEPQDVLDAWVEKVVRAGIQPNIHANGDVAIDMALTAFERAQAKLAVKDLRPKITHCTLVNAGILKRMAALGAVPAPFTSYAYYNSDKFGFYGADRMAQAMAFRDFLDHGIKVCAGSDFFPGPFAPLMGIQGMVTRTGWNGETWGANQRVSVLEAIRINSLNGAWAAKEEAIKGSLTAGKLADYVVLAEDPTVVKPDHIKDIKIIETVVDGRSMHRA
ncbi:amidohydrolase [Sandarakinorhabdus sp.]|uniref:amidohydrolase n=1 Tax=Sandarakinorhabdus sp. TaxID=1916663 RepID=UPI00286DBD27|nr:amidohydrolase [Sandarakinorhabdus sp.]